MPMGTSASKNQADSSSPSRRSHLRGAILGLFLLCTYVLVAYWRAFAQPFLNDDYFFIDKVVHSSFVDIWRPERLYFFWYRPWSRELHYWALWRLFGEREWAYHVVSFILWLVVAVLYFRLVERITKEPFAAAIALTGM